ncbi:MAG: serine/threonine-protein kinase [Polyangiales bacterium]
MRTCPSCGRQYEPPAQFCQVDGTSLRIDGPATDPYIGTRILDHFRIARVIGSGGMGIVYEAQDEALGRRVAIKILHRDLLSNKDIVARFHREAQIAHQLDHPGIVRVVLFGQLPDQNLYLVLEFLEGPTLLEALEASGAFEVARAVKIVAQVGDAVGYTHTRGIIHRDLKPENIILTKREGDPEFPKVLDFGIAKTLVSANSFVTQSGLIFGTARYISPEGASGDPVDQRSDVYSLAVIAYQLLTGRTPFDAEEPVQLLMKHLHEPAPPMSRWPAGQRVPEAVADVVMRALAKNADARHPDAGAFARALRDALQRSGMRAEPDFSGPGSLVSIVPTTAMTLTDPTGSALRATPVPPARRNDADTTLDRPSSLGAKVVALSSASTAESGGVARVRTTSRGSGDLAHAPLAALSNGAVVPPIADLPQRVEIPVVAVAPITPTSPPPDHGREARFFESPRDAEVPAPEALLTETRPEDFDEGGDLYPVRGIERPGATRRAVLLVLASMVFAASAMAAGAYLLRWYPAQQREDRIAELMRRANDAFHLGRLTTNADGSDVETLTDAVLAEEPRNPRALALRRSAAIQLQNEATAHRNASAFEVALPILTSARRLSADPSIQRDLEACRAELERQRAAPPPPPPPARPVRPARRAPQDPEVIHPAQPALPVVHDAGPSAPPPTAPPAAAAPPPETPRPSASRSRRRPSTPAIQVPGLGALDLDPAPPRERAPAPVDPTPRERVGTF